MQAECPYCGKEIDIDISGENYGDGDNFDNECPKCLKHFVCTVSISVDLDTEKCDCLNNGNHKELNEYGECKACGEYVP